MSSLGFQLVYSLINERDDVVCERFFLPEAAEQPLSIESGRPLADFPFVFISVSFEHDYQNLVKILLHGGIAPFSIDRLQNEQDSPLVLCGGVATFMNPEPIAPFIDLFVIGEAEPVLDDLLDVLLEKQISPSRKQHLKKIALSFDGVYVPSLYQPVYSESKNCVGMRAIDDAPAKIKRSVLRHCEKVGHSELLTPAAEFSNLYLTELGRGCSRGCRFCAAGFIYRPPRLWDADSVVQGINERDENVKRIGLLGMEMASDTSLEVISSYLLDSGCALSFSSLRADRINEKLLKLLAESNLKSVAIAPDGASERLRRVINKGLRHADILTAAKRLVEAGIFKLKLYVMVGLPTETCEDLQELIDLIETIKSEIDPIGQKRGRLSDIYLSVNCFVPKPWTPFQFHSFGIAARLENGEQRSAREAVKNLKEKISYLKKGVQKFSNVYFQADKPENALFQAFLSRGDRRVAQVLHDMVVKRIPWKSSMKSNNLNVEDFITTGFSENSYFPWYIIDHGIKEEYLWKEYMKGFESAPTIPCDITICRRCGVCGER